MLYKYILHVSGRVLIIYVRYIYRLVCHIYRSIGMLHDLNTVSLRPMNDVDIGNTIYDMNMTAIMSSCLAHTIHFTLSYQLRQY